MFTPGEWFETVAGLVSALKRFFAPPCLISALGHRNLEHLLQLSVDYLRLDQLFELLLVRRHVNQLSIAHGQLHFLTTVENTLGEAEDHGPVPHGHDHVLHEFHFLPHLTIFDHQLTPCVVVLSVHHHEHDHQQKVERRVERYIGRLVLPLAEVFKRESDQGRDQVNRTVTVK